MFAIFFFARNIVSGQPVETPLGQIAAGADSIQVLLREDSSGEKSLSISAGSETSRQGFFLKTPCAQTLNKKLATALKIEAVDSSDTNNLVATFGVDETGGDAKWVGVWLSKVNGRWALRGEWAVEKFNHKELGEKSETQSFAFESGVLKRSTSRNNIEGIKTTCPQGCCVAWQSKTLVTEEVETLSWNKDLRAVERKSFRKWYVAQYGDGVISIAQKVFGNPEKLATLYRLNPGLEKQDKVVEGQKILVERN